MAKKTNKAVRVFDTIADIGSLMMALLYILYVALLLIFELGTLWLNYAMLGITIAYIVFFLTKIFLLNRILRKKGVIKTTRLALKYSKWGMKVINATFVALSIASTQLSDSSDVISMMGIFLVGFSFLISVLWDIAWHVVQRKVRELKSDWDSLSRAEKNKRIELIIDSFVTSVDHITGVDITKSLAQNAGRLADERKEEESHQRRRRDRVETEDDDF